MNDVDIHFLLRRIAHDLRGNVGSSASLAKMIEQNYSDVLDERALKWLSLITKEYERAQMQLSRVSQLGRLFNCQVEQTVCDAKELFMQSVDKLCTVNESAQGIKTKYSCKLSSPLLSDPILLSELLLELVTNSIRYAKPKGQDDLVLSLSISENQHNVNLIYADNGSILSPLDVEPLMIKKEPMFSSKLRPSLGIAKIRQISKILDAELAFGIDKERQSGLMVGLVLPKHN